MDFGEQGGRVLGENAGYLGGDGGGPFFTPEKWTFGIGLAGYHMGPKIRART